MKPIIYAYYVQIQTVKNVLKIILNAHNAKILLDSLMEILLNFVNYVILLV